MSKCQGVMYNYLNLYTSTPINKCKFETWQKIILKICIAVAASSYSFFIIYSHMYVCLWPTYHVTFQGFRETSQIMGQVSLVLHPPFILDIKREAGIN